MPVKKMMPPLPDALGGSEYDRFTRFAKTILAVPRAKVMPEQVLSKLEAERQNIEGKITGVRWELAKGATRKPVRKWKDFGREEKLEYHTPNDRSGRQ
jgi:hypothetical protein